VATGKPRHYTILDGWPRRGRGTTTDLGRKTRRKKNSQTLTRATNWIYLRPVSRDPELI